MKPDAGLLGGEGVASLFEEGIRRLRWRQGEEVKNQGLGM